MNPTIRYVERKDIDIVKWDHCVNEATNGLIYAYSYYLDKMSHQWHGLVMGDYESVMPLTWNKKYGLHYLYQPPFTASLGIFGKQFNDDKINSFIHAIPNKFRLVEIDMNYGNNLLVPSEVFTTRNNYTLNLNKTYSGIVSHYRDNIKRNIRKAEQLNCRYATNIPIDDVIALSKMQMQKVSNLSANDYDRFKELFEHLQQKQMAITCGIYCATNELLASCVFFFSHNRAYYILVGNHPNGKTLGASHYLIDRFIFEHAEKPMLLDFEGSDISNLAFFYSSYGATIENYPALRINRLPWWAKLFK